MPLDGWVGWNAGLPIHANVMWPEEWHLPSIGPNAYDLHSGNAVIRSLAAAYGIRVMVSSG